MSANNIRAGGAFVEIFATTGKLQLGLAKSQSMVAAFAASSQRQMSGFQRTLLQPLTLGMATLPATALSSFAATLTGLGMAGGGIAAGVTVPLAAAGRQAVEFQKQMAGVSTMLDDKSFLPGFRDRILTMSREVGESTTNLAVSLRELIGSAIAPADAIDVLDVATRTARAGMVDTATAALLLANNINAFQLEARDAEDIADTLFTVVKNGVVTFEELAKHFGESTATAHAAGISIQESGAAFATMTRNGLKADLAVTALNGIMAEFLKPSKDGAQVAQRFGLELSTAAIRSNGFVQVMEELSKLPEDALARIFPDVRGLRGMLAIRGDLKGFKNDIESMRGRGGAMAAAFGIMDATQAANIDKATAGIREMAIAIGTQLLPLVNDVAVAIRAASFGVATWANQNPDLIKQIALLTAGVGLASIALVGLGLTGTLVGAGLVTVLAPVGALLATLGFLKAAIVALPTISAVLGVGTAIATTLVYFGYFDEQVAASGEFLTETFTAVGAWFQDWGKFLGETFGEAWSGITSAVARNDLQSAFQIGVSGVEVVWSDALQRMGDAWDEWGGFLGDVIENVKHQIAHLALTTQQVFQSAKRMTMDEPDDGNQPSGLGEWYDSYVDWWRKGSTMRDFDERQREKYRQENGDDVTWAEGDKYFKEAIAGTDPNNKWFRDRQDFEATIDREDNARRAARADNDPLADARAELNAEHEKAEQKRRAQREASAKARAAKALEAQANLQNKLLIERLEAAVNAGGASSQTGPLGVRPKGPDPPSLPMPADLEKSAKLPTSGSFSITALRGMVGGGANVASEQRQRMIRLLERIAAERERSAARREKRIWDQWSGPKELKARIINRTDGIVAPPSSSGGAVFT